MGISERSRTPGRARQWRTLAGREDEPIWPAAPASKYAAAMAFQRISRDPMIMAGVPCIKGTRIPAATVVAYVGEGQSPEDIAREFPQLTVADVRAALSFAAETLREREIPLSTSA